MITKEAFIQSANKLQVEEAAIRAVAEVEGNGKGFLADGKPLILFEPHIYWKELKARGINPKFYQKGNEDIIYEKWGTKPYGKPSEQHARLDRAARIHREAALSSCSWGMFQIMGFNFSLCGCESLQEFINKMYKDMDSQLELFVNFLINKKLDKLLRNHAWEAFAKAYNGSGYKKNKYDTKLEAAYNKHALIK